MKIIDEQLLTAISGAGGAPATPANTIGTSMIVGAISGIPGGPGGMLGGAVVAGSLAAIGMINSKGPVFGSGSGRPPSGVTLPWCMMGNSGRSACN